VSSPPGFGSGPPACSQSLYRLSYLAHIKSVYIWTILCTLYFKRKSYCLFRLCFISAARYIFVTSLRRFNPLNTSGYFMYSHV